MSRKQTPDSFWSKVDKTGACWEWQAYTNSFGYGVVSWHGRLVLAHRLAYWLTHPGFELLPPKSKSEPGWVLHQCDNPKCCNPAHLSVGTYSDNQKAAYARQRRAQPKGQEHANAKLTSRDVETIRRFYPRLTQKELAAIFDVSKHTIGLVVRRETYKCL